MGFSAGGGVVGITTPIGNPITSDKQQRMAAAKPSELRLDISSVLESTLERSSLDEWKVGRSGLFISFIALQEAVHFNYVISAGYNGEVADDEHASK